MFSQGDIDILQSEQEAAQSSGKAVPNHDIKIDINAIKRAFVESELSRSVHVYSSAYDLSSFLKEQFGAARAALNVLLQEIGSMYVSLEEYSLQRNLKKVLSQAHIVPMTCSVALPSLHCGNPVFLGHGNGQACGDHVDIHCR